jgi:hypothetical protein
MLAFTRQKLVNNMTVFGNKSVDEVREFIYFGNIMNSVVQRDYEN